MTFEKPVLCSPQFEAIFIQCCSLAQVKVFQLEIRIYLSYILGILIEQLLRSSFIQQSHIFLIRLFWNALLKK
ncbi:hypothetical protein M5K25_003135 [Dendrobium thyrsiflorum]|uniref:Uncharacterized protein n=1 Tax=Dendrobium thyrsiflorum TaxID=117978 RepID=A0ABD0VP91_DENTH